MRWQVLLVAVALVGAPAASSAQKADSRGDSDHQHSPASSTAAVDFGVLPKASTRMLTVSVTRRMRFQSTHAEQGVAARSRSLRR